MLSGTEKIKEIKSEFKTFFGNLWCIKVNDVNDDYVIDFQYAGDCEIPIDNDGDICFFLNIFGNIHYYKQVSAFTVNMSLEVAGAIYNLDLYTGYFHIDGWVDPYTIKETVANFINQKLEKIKWAPAY
jgi:hypothetical protein